MTRSQATTDKIQEFFGLCSYHLAKVGVTLAQDTDGFDDLDDDKLVSDTKDLLSFLAALDSELNTWTDQKVNLYIEHTITKYGLKNYPVAAGKYWGVNNVRATLPIYQGGGTTIGGGTGTRLEDGSLVIRSFNGRWVMTTSGSTTFKTIAAREEVVDKATYNQDKAGFAKTSDINTLSQAITEDRQRLSEIEEFNSEFTGEPADVLYKGNLNKPNGPLALNEQGKVSEQYLPNSGQSEIFIDTWNALTNDPPIPPATEDNKGWYYRVAVGGSTVIDGFSDWVVDAKLLSNGDKWVNFPPPGGTGTGGETTDDYDLLIDDLDLDADNGDTLDIDDLAL